MKIHLKNYPVFKFRKIFSWLHEYSSDFNYKDIFNIVYSKFDDGFGHEIFRIFLLKKEGYLEQA